jgi:hypothetical protein
VNEEAAGTPGVDTGNTGTRELNCTVAGTEDTIDVAGVVEHDTFSVLDATAVM